jgi:hypothetical protein
MLPPELFFYPIYRKKTMLTERELRRLIRQTLKENISNFITPQKQTATKQLKDTSKSEIIGDPISDVKMNQNADNLGSYEANSPTVAVKAGATKGGKDYTTGQKQAKFSGKTTQAK